MKVAQTDVPVRVGTDGTPQQSRIIGLELRLVDRETNRREEVAIVACDVRYPVLSTPWGRRLFSLNLTVHTTDGDTTFPLDAELP